MITEQENKLFEEWSKNRKGFVADGVPVQESYLNSDLKIMVVLKEVNDQDGGGWDLREFLREGARAQTWNNITRWVKGIRNLNRDLDWAELEKIDNLQRQETLKSICAINVNKSPGGCVADNEKLSKVAAEDKKFLTKQFLIYNPDLVICCGTVTSEIFHDSINFTPKPDWHRTNRGIYYHIFRDQQCIIEYVHPEARVHPCLLYYGIVDAVKSIFGQR